MSENHDCSAGVRDVSEDVRYAPEAAWPPRSMIRKYPETREVDVDGLGLVQGVCGSPEFDHPGTATEGQVFFILMEVARSELGT